MKCSIGVGTLSAKREPHREIMDEHGVVVETIYRTELEMDGFSFLATGSEFILRDLKGKVKVEYYIRSEREKVTTKLITSIHILICEPVHDETPDFNEVHIVGMVKSRKKLRVLDKTGLHIFTFLVRYFSHDKNYNVAHCVAWDRVARQHSTLKEGDIVHIVGHLKGDPRGLIEVEVETIEQKGKKG